MNPPRTPGRWLAYPLQIAGDIGADNTSPEHGQSWCGGTPVTNVVASCAAITPIKGRLVCGGLLLFLASATLGGCGPRSTVTARGDAPPPADPDSPTDSEPSHSLETPIADAPPETVVTGRVTDLQGDPIAGAVLRIQKWDRGPAHASTTQTDADGRFTLPAPPGKSRLFVFADGYASLYRTHDIEAGVNRGWDFALPRAAHVSGRVVDTRGTPQPGRVLELWPVHPGPPPAPGVSLYRSGGQGDDTRGADGTFDMPSVAPGRHRVIVYQPSPIGGDRCLQQVPVRGRFLDVAPGDRVADFEIAVHPPEGFAIAGHVRDAAGAPLANVTVDTFIPHGRHWWTKTDEHGAFRLAGLDGLGQSTLKVHFLGIPGAEGYTLAIPDVPLGAEALEFVYAGQGNIRGTVVDAATGAAVSTYEVRVPQVRLPDSGAVWETPTVHVTRHDDGRFEVANVPAGVATVEVRAAGRGVQRFVTSVAADTTTPLDCRMAGPAVFAGRTTLNGTPRRTTILINGEWLSSDDEGRFRFDQFPNGKLLAWFWVHDSWHRTVAVDLRSGETTRRDVELGGSAEVRGTVTFPPEQPYCSVRLAARPAPDGWYEFGRPAVEECVLAYAHVREPGGEYHLQNIPPGRWHLLVGDYHPSMHRSLLAAERVVEVRDGETLRIDFDLTGKERRSGPAEGVD
jgi:hypothetical protein